MRLNSLKAILKTTVPGASVLLLGAGLASAQQQVNLSAGPSTITLPDGSAVPMWGYSCGAAATGSTATCASLHTGATGWSPVVDHRSLGTGSHHQPHQQPCLRRKLDSHFHHHRGPVGRWPRNYGHE